MTKKAYFRQVCR